MFNPIASYRFQFNKEFTFKDFELIISYLEKLGVSTVYASPIFEAVPGSTHGYDGLNSHKINPEIGTEAQLKEITKQLQAKNINWLQDIVPNHMAFDPRNPWIMDVLEKGPESIYAPYFDITWSDQLHHGRLMVPFLGAPVEEVIRNKELKVDYKGQRFVFNYFDTYYPLKPRTYSTILHAVKDKVPDAIHQLLQQVPKTEDEKAYETQWEEIRIQLASLMKNGPVKTFIKKCIDHVNKDQTLIQQIADSQSYRLCYWKETDSMINYRRFFIVNGLICLNMQNKVVFDDYHGLIRSLAEEGVFQGLRVDHIDGLYDPSQYLQWLREMAGSETYIVVEKILEPGEGIPKSWPVQGTTGYDFLSLVNNLFTNKDSKQLFNRFYLHLTKDNRTLQQLLYDKKAHILFNHMGGELENLYHLFLELNIVEKKAYSSIRKEELKEAIGEFLIHCPVYRYYGNHFPLEQEEADSIQKILNHIRRDNEDLSLAVSILEETLLKKPHEGDVEKNQRIAKFYQRCMQFTGPLMAKGIEDTLMYTYNRFIGINEVGDSPEAFGMTKDEFHKAMYERKQFWPLALNATATHDTKRGEDVRARLNVLTDLPEEWFQLVNEWQKLNKDLKQNNSPDANDEYFIYQTIIGSYPMPGDEADDYIPRLQEYIQKSLREAKTHSAWTEPNQEYESAAKNFAASILDRSRPFWKSFESFQKKITDYGIINSLSQVVIKFTCPGVPDTYQGCELWDFSFVDPDNRRKVDYQKRSQLLNDLENKELTSLLKKLWEERHTGQIKLWLTNMLMNLQKQQPELFIKGDYSPLKVEGTYKDHVLAFERRYKQTAYIIILPLFISRLCKEQNANIQEIDWKDTKVLLPKEVESQLQNVLITAEVNKGKALNVKELFETFPISILKGNVLINERSAGILLHITSLPSAYGIGDMGPEAKKFADFLQRSRQRFWQLLPLNPIEAGQGYSPYSALSSRAGNPLLISPELLVYDGLLNTEDLSNYHIPQEGKTNYKEAERVKGELLDKAYQNFLEHKSNIHLLFQQFCEQESTWLHDFALFMVLKKEKGGKPWFQWDEEYKLRVPEAIEKFAHENNEEINKVKWIQFIFSKQWKALKDYCNDQGIQLIGDLPFYVSYDSSDVWSQKEIFAIDEHGNRTGMAGVPPDAFSSDGQLWGMPVYKWDVLKERGYDWWTDRLLRNKELFDLIRIDHFRAFAEYWEVPAGEATAKNGQWKPGPGEEFFENIKDKLGDLPFVAEDLGEVDDKVFNLRDQFLLPGMKVLQFAFSDDMPESNYIPHNYEQNFIVYTGTHDNDTIRGWYKSVDEATRKRVEQYTGRGIQDSEVHYILGRMAYGSVARLAILPLQDVLGLDETARMNVPASGENNWGWRLYPGQLNHDAERLLQEWTWLFNRD